ncbi:MAG TPA: UDP-3-O-(3-hydroxymyristoyl)glucosamine N-acyltransferase [Gemmataceae bacterium]|nr:UDP-3-O-(3-hydroxymyristoyl)glucosamine N-acyltransferase [Gemmataceae bacterium]
MSATIGQLAELVRGRVVGDPGLEITAAQPLGEAGAGHITFLESAKLAPQLHACAASAAVVPQSLPTNGLTVIQVEDPLAAFVTIRLHLHGRPTPPPHGIDPAAAVDRTSRIGGQPSIHPFASVGEGTVIGARCRIHSGVVVGRRCRLGDDVTIHPNAVLYDDTVVGNRVTIHANAVIGADGFGYRFQDCRHVKVPQLGHVEIGNDVEIGACTTIDRGTFQATRIADGTKIDNLVQVAHNCQIGRHNLLVSQMGIAGSSSTGDYVVVAGQVGIRDHVHVGHRAVIGARAGVASDVAEGERMLGAPARPERHEKRIMMSLDKLPEIRRDVRKIKQRLGMTDGPEE